MQITTRTGQFSEFSQCVHDDLAGSIIMWYFVNVAMILMHFTLTIIFAQETDASGLNFSTLNIYFSKLWRKTDYWSYKKVPFKCFYFDIYISINVLLACSLWLFVKYTNKFWVEMVSSFCWGFNAVQRLITSKMQVCVYILYVCV